MADDERKPIRVVARNYLKIVKIPYFEDSGAILDNPPNFPNVNFVSYRGRDDRMSMLLNAGQGSLEQDPIVFNEAEQQHLELFRESRKLNDVQPILYKSDEFENLPKVFEIRRLAIAPESYADFDNASTTLISTPYGQNSKAASANYMDSIEPNKKYYYMFRAVDRRGIYSNPTAVYEIEMVENSGAVYPLINSYEMKKEFKPSTKSLKRLFNIVPRLKQVLPAIGSNKLGTEKRSLFGKEFKIRLTSKKTGKVIDLNVEFKRENIS